MMDLSDSEKRVINLRRQYSEYWRNKPDNYWLQRLMQEVGEAASVLAGDHDDTLEHELTQISAICINWLDKLMSPPPPNPPPA